MALLSAVRNKLMHFPPATCPLLITALRLNVAFYQMADPRKPRQIVSFLYFFSRNLTVSVATISRSARIEKGFIIVN